MIPFSIILSGLIARSCCLWWSSIMTWSLVLTFIILSHAFSRGLTLYCHRKVYQTIIERNLSLDFIQTLSFSSIWYGSSFIWINSAKIGIESERYWMAFYLCDLRSKPSNGSQGTFYIYNYKLSTLCKKFSMKRRLLDDKISRQEILAVWKL